MGRKEKKERKKKIRKQSGANWSGGANKGGGKGKFNPKTKGRKNSFWHKDHSRGRGGGRGKKQNQSHKIKGIPPFSLSLFLQFGTHLQVSLLGTNWIRINFKKHKGKQNQIKIYKLNPSRIFIPYHFMQPRASFLPPPPYPCAGTQ